MRPIAHFALALCLAGCGRTSLPEAKCLLEFSPSEIEFGEVEPGAVASRSVSLDNTGGEVCVLSNIGLSADSGAGFFLPGAPQSISILPFQSASIAVAFQPASASLPLERSGKLLFRAGDDASQVPLHARIKSNCKVAVSPAAVDFGHVKLGAAATREVTVSDVGTGPCELGDIALGKGSDLQFSVGGPGQINLAPGQSRTIPVSFTASDLTPPHHRTGTLVFQTTDPNQIDVVVPLSADIDIGCNLTISPPALDFGNVILNTTVHAPVTLGNDGSEPCVVSGIALGIGTDPLFSLDAGQPGGVTVGVGASVPININFTASDSAPPHLKTGTLVFQTGNPRAPSAVVPLSAYINTVCVEASQWIYTVDDAGILARFDPPTLSFTNLGAINCPDFSIPNSMAVDQNAVAWVAYQSGNLYRVDTGTAACSATTFQSNQHGLLEFGMGFVFDPTTGLDTLYIAGGSSTTLQQSTLATISFPSLIVDTIGPTEGLPELSGTGDGTLWGFFPGSGSSSGFGTLVRIDPKSGATLESYPYSSLPGGSAWAMKFWGGFFWIFLDQSVYKVDRLNPKIVTLVIPNTGRRIVGAGVSTCAPLH